MSKKAKEDMMNTDNKSVCTIKLQNEIGAVYGDGFSVALHNIDVAGKMHIHDCYELEVLVNGEVTVRLNGKQVNAQKGAFWLSIRNNLHRVIKCSDNTEIISIKFDDSFLSNKIYNLLGMYPDGIVGKVEQRDIDAFINILEKALGAYIDARSELCKSIFIKNTLEAVLVLFIDKCDDFPAETSEEMTEHNILEAVSYIKKHFTENLKANEIAARLGYTPNYFSMKFKNLIGKNFIEAVNDERLQLAYYMLSTMDISINEVSEYVGYSSVAYFSRLFKKKFKKSPSEVKKLERNTEK